MAVATETSGFELCVMRSSLEWTSTSLLVPDMGRVRGVVEEVLPSLTGRFSARRTGAALCTTADVCVTVEELGESLVLARVATLQFVDVMGLLLLSVVVIFLRVLSGNGSAWVRAVGSRLGRFCFFDLFFFLFLLFLVDFTFESVWLVVASSCAYH